MSINGKKYISKKDRIVMLFDNLEWFKSRKEGIDYILWYKPTCGWYYREMLKDIIMMDNKNLPCKVYRDYGETYFLGKNYEIIRKEAGKAMFAWQIFGGNRELLNAKKINVNVK